MAEKLAKTVDKTLEGVVGVEDFGPDDSNKHTLKDITKIDNETGDGVGKSDENENGD